MATTLVLIAYILGSFVVVAFGTFAIVYTFIRHRKQGPDTTEFFLTARRSIGWFTIAWSFYAAAMGSWALFSPPSYSYYAGILGLACYSVAAGFPILIIAFFGGHIHDLIPDIFSFTDYVKRRFGMVVTVWVSLLMLLNMGVALTAEFTAVGDLYNIVIGAVRWPIVVIIALVSTIYTAYGGLHVSIITDQIQAFTSLIMVLVLFIFVCVTFEAPLPRPLPAVLRASNPIGLASIATLPISLISATIFSEAMWQRCWATSTKRELRLGALIGSTVVMCVVFLFGFGGVLATWSGLFVPSGPNDYGNTILFSLLDNVNGGRHTAITVVVAVLAVTMSTSAVDSLQNALVDTISGTYLKRVRLLWVRLLVLVLTIPCLIVSLKSYNIIQLFLVSNLLTSTSSVPVMMGLWHTPLGLKVVTSFSMLFGCANGMAAIAWWSKLDQHSFETYGQSLKRIITMEYQYQSFMLAVGMSFVGLLVGAALEWVFRKVAKKPYNLTDPFIQKDIMPVDNQVAATNFKELDTKDVSSDDEKDAVKAGAL